MIKKVVRNIEKIHINVKKFRKLYFEISRSYNHLGGFQENDLCILLQTNMPVKLGKRFSLLFLTRMLQVLKIEKWRPLTIVNTRC